jgi:hypothetical protein
MAAHAQYDLILGCGAGWLHQEGFSSGSGKSATVAFGDKGQCSVLVLGAACPSWEEQLWCMLLSILSSELASRSVPSVLLVLFSLCRSGSLFIGVQVHWIVHMDTVDADKSAFKEDKTGPCPMTKCCKDPESTNLCSLWSCRLMLEYGCWPFVGSNIWNAQAIVQTEGEVLCLALPAFALRSSSYCRSQWGL